MDCYIEGACPRWTVILKGHVLDRWLIWKGCYFLSIIFTIHLDSFKICMQSLHVVAIYGYKPTIKCIFRLACCILKRDSIIEVDKCVFVAQSRLFLQNMHVGVQRV